MNKQIYPDGSVEGGFSKVDLPYPRPKHGVESFRQYRARVDKLVEQGFHLGDLGWTDWGYYCMGSGQFEGVDSNDIIGA